MSTMLNFHTQNLRNTVLTEQEIKHNCPAAFLTEPTGQVSDKYVLVRTIDVVNDLGKLGWQPVAAVQRVPRKNSETRFNFHMIAFQNPNVKIVKEDPENGGEIVDCFPRIILTNSMDGTSSFRFMVGLLRLVCSNGLVIGSDMLADMSIRHIYYSFEDLKDLVNRIVAELPIQVDRINEMRKVTLSDVQKKDFALKAYKIRKGLTLEDSVEEVDNGVITNILSPLRKEDEDNSLWSVMNVIQEKMVQGGFSTLPKKDGKRPRKVRAIKSFVRDLDFNKKFWNLASSYVPLQEAA